MGKDKKANNLKDEKIAAEQQSREEEKERYRLDIDLKEIENKSEEELLDYVVDQLMKMKQAQFYPIELEEEYAEYVEEDISSKIDYNHNEFLYGIPQVDERLDDFYDDLLFVPENKKGKVKIESDVMPFHGYFNVLDFETKLLILGLIDIKINYKKVGLKSGDERFDHDERVWKKEEAFIYSFNEQKYNSVPLENESHTRTLLYQERKMLARKILSKLKKPAREYQESWKEFYKKSLGDTKLVSEIIDYLEFYKDFLDNKAKKGLKLYLAYSHITVDEYNELLKEVENFSEMCQNAILELEAYIESKQSKNNAKVSDFMNNQEPKDIRDTLDLIVEKGQNDDEAIRLFNKLFNTEGENIIKKLEYFKTPRIEISNINKNVSIAAQGYIGFDLEKMVLYPNISEIERRRSRKSEATTQDFEKLLQRRYLLWEKEQLNTLKDVEEIQEVEKEEEIKIETPEQEEIKTKNIREEILIGTEEDFDEEVFSIDEDWDIEKNTYKYKFYEKFGFKSVLSEDLIIEILSKEEEIEKTKLIVSKGAKEINATMENAESRKPLHSEDDFWKDKSFSDVE